MKFTLIAALAALTFGYAGGDVAPVYETPIVVVQENTDKNLYVGGSLTYVDSEFKENFTWFDLESSETGYGLGGQVGFTFYRLDSFYASVEGRIQKTFWNYGSDLADASALTYSALIKPTYAFDEFNIYGLGGYGSSKVSNFALSERENGFVWGLGGGYTFSETVEITLDYVWNPSIDDIIFDNVRTDVLTLGVNYKF